MMTQNGILLIDKPEGPSSAQVVHQVKKILGAKKVGHLGTLDPFASGLLLIGINEGTKIADIFLGGVKSYRGVMMLGIETDTQDGTGKVVLQRPVPNISKSELRSLEKKFTGALQQVPPMFSALKKDGVRLYHLARQGKEIPREPRSIRIDALCLKPLSDREVEIEVTCSRGTYVRTLAADMGKELGCGAHLKNLRRVACDHLAVTQAIDIEELRKRFSTGVVQFLSLSSALNHLRAVSWQSSLVTRLRLGQQEALGQIGKRMNGEVFVRVLDARGELAALAKWNEDIPGGRWRLSRVFHE
jgi:tRNA pseudouridine55 synthase